MMRASFPKTPFKAVFWKVVTSSSRASKYLAKNIETLTWWNLIIILIISWYFWQVLKSSSVLIIRINYNRFIRLGSAKKYGEMALLGMQHPPLVNGLWWPRLVKRKCWLLVMKQWGLKCHFGACTTWILYRGKEHCMEYLRHMGDIQASDAVLGAVELKGESANV